MFESNHIHYKFWQLFLLIGLGYSLTFHFFYKSELFNIFYWIAEIILVFFIHQKTANNKRWFYFSYPFLFVYSYIAIKITISPYIQWNFDFALNEIDKMLFGKTPSLFLSAYEKPQYTEYLSMSYLASLFYFVIVSFYYLYDTSIFKVNRFFKGLISIYAISFCFIILFPVKGPKIYLKELYHNDLFGGKFAILNDFFIKLYTNNLDTFPGLQIAVTLFIWLSFTRDAKIFSLISFPVLVLTIISTVYLRYYYFSECIIGIFLALIAFFCFSGGYKNHKIPTKQDDNF